MQPMSIDQALLGDEFIHQVLASADGVYWLAMLPAEGSRVTIRHFDGFAITELTPSWNVRSRVMSYGGGAYAVAEGMVAWCDDATSSVWLLENGQARQISASSSRFRFGGLRLVPQRRWLLAVREDHAETPEERTEIVALNLDGDNPTGGQVLVTGADFYAGCRAFGDKLAWFQWQHPNMSWDEAAVFTAPLDNPGQATAITAAAQVSAQHPMWLADGRLAYVSDESGYWNWTVAGEGSEVTWRTPHDCSTPAWQLDAPPACPVGEDRIATLKLSDGRGELAVWDVATGEVSYPLPGTAMIESVAAWGDDLYVIAEWPDRANSLVHLRGDGSITEIVSSQPLPGVSEPISHWATGPAGPVQSWFYPVPGVVSPPLLVLTHGGPTSAHSCGFERQVQFWVSRGVAVLDVNYSGSTGFGRAYRNRLRGQWGLLDVADVVASAKQVCAAGWADPNRVAIAGGSAGGYTTLQALVSSDFFAAGISAYGIADLTSLLDDTHKTESHYTFSLVGPWPEAEQLYRDRSPINQISQLNSPMLLLQGLADRVVPPSQAYAMADAVRAKGLPLALVTFPDEGHGFRGLANRRRALESRLSFLEQIFGMPLSPDIPLLQLEGPALG